MISIRLVLNIGTIELLTDIMPGIYYDNRVYLACISEIGTVYDIKLRHISELTYSIESNDIAYWYKVFYAKFLPYTTIKPTINCTIQLTTTEYETSTKQSIKNIRFEILTNNEIIEQLEFDCDSFLKQQFLE